MITKSQRDALRKLSQDEMKGLLRTLFTKQIKLPSGSETSEPWNDAFYSRSSKALLAMSPDEFRTLLSEKHDSLFANSFAIKGNSLAAKMARDILISVSMLCYKLSIS